MGSAQLKLESVGCKVLSLKRGVKSVEPGVHSVGWEYNVWNVKTRGNCKVWNLEWKVGIGKGGVYMKGKVGSEKECKVWRGGYKVWNVESRMSSRECKKWSGECKVWGGEYKVWNVKTSGECKVWNGECTVWIV